MPQLVWNPNRSHFEARVSYQGENKLLVVEPEAFVKNVDELLAPPMEPTSPLDANMWMEILWDKDGIYLEDI